MQELLGILIAMLCGRGQIGDGFLIIPLDLFSVEINLSELVFRIVVTVLRCNLEVTDCPKDILDFCIRQPDFSCKIGGIRMVPLSSAFAYMVSAPMSGMPFVPYSILPVSGSNQP